jgi:hypothetical protein
VHRIADRIIRRVISQPTERQHVADQINAALVFARADLVNVHQSQRSKPAFQSQPRFGSAAGSDGVVHDLPFDGSQATPYVKIRRYLTFFFVPFDILEW